VSSTTQFHIFSWQLCQCSQKQADLILSCFSSISSWCKVMYLDTKERNQNEYEYKVAIVFLVLDTQNKNNEIQMGKN